jgi:predicted RNase H-like HicB family nuclease
MRTKIRYSALVLGSRGEFAAWCPALRGCWSQGATRAEALEKVRSAMLDYVIVRGAAKRRRRGRP